MAAAAVHLSERIFERVGDQRVLFVGAGEMIELCAAHFCGEKPRKVINANGSPCMEIRIVDNGPGLAPERVETLFNPGARNSDKPGGGVGLPLVRELVAAVGGTILCRSQPGSGTVFQIYLPLAATH